jgi:hypothetical protein
VHCDVYRADNPEMKAMFEEATRGRALVAEWRDAEADGYPVLDVVLRHGRTADLVVVGQTEREWWGSHYLDVADRLPVEAGRPVLIIPKSPSKSAVGVSCCWRRPARNSRRLGLVIDTHRASA